MDILCSSCKFGTPEVGSAQLITGYSTNGSRIFELFSDSDFDKCEIKCDKI
jgi:hypothetical protein